jgi:peptidoglycan/LPS O-acetylase OafA/YrhL
MIQRIQSGYLFLALLALGALFSRLPLVQSVGTGGALEHNETFFIAQELLFGISALITFFSIFLYANRKRQMMAVKGAILLTVLGLITIAVDYFVSSGKVGATNLSVDPFAVIGTVVLILQVMGHKGIRSDEKLVREADRLR